VRWQTLRHPLVLNACRDEPADGAWPAVFGVIRSRPCTMEHRHITPDKPAAHVTTALRLSFPMISAGTSRSRSSTLTASVDQQYSCDTIPPPQNPNHRELSPEPAQEPVASTHFDLLPPMQQPDQPQKPARKLCVRHQRMADEGTIVKLQAVRISNSISLNLLITQLRARTVT